MRAWSFGSGMVVGASALVVAAVVGACSGAKDGGFNPTAGSGPGGTSSDGGGTGNTGPSGPSPVFDTDGGGPTGSTGPGVLSDGGIACPTGLTCNVSCSDGGTTTITGKVYDPAGNNPLYNVAVYVPATPLVALPKGVPTGADSCSCDALFKSGALTNTTTAVDGSFTLTNVPVGASVPLVIQVGKWRRQISVNVAACQDNAQLDKSVKFLGTIPAGDTIDSMPDIAVSTGSYDTLECLMIRIGIPGTEYVAGAGTTGHVHVFAGGKSGSGTGTGDGQAETPKMTGAPTSWTALWDQQSDMMPYDIVLLSCEGGETYNANPTVLEQYLNAGGRAFGSHYHYAWFAGTIQGQSNTPAPPTDWGTNLAVWGPNLSTSTTGAATIDQTLTGTTKAFPKGVALDQWLGIVGALGVESAPAGQIPVFDEEQDVGATSKAQAWLVDNGYTDYMSFDTPVNAPVPEDGGSPAYCGRAVFSDIHVNSDTNFPTDTSPPPAGCQSHLLSPQEKALEFMLFDLSSCVLPDTVAPPLDAGLPPPPAPK